MKPPLVVVGRHRNRKSALDCDPIQKNAERCKNLTSFASRCSNGASAYPSDAPAYRWDGGGVRGIGARKPNEREQTYFSMR
jgi:hypothetical protein